MQKITDRDGYILLWMILILLFLSVTAVAINRGTGMKTQMTASMRQSTQINFGEQAMIEHGLWDLTRDPGLRVPDPGEDVTFNGTAFKRRLTAATQTGYTDAVAIDIARPDADRHLRAYYRYYVLPPYAGYDSGVEPIHIARDATGDLYFADPQTHCVYKRNAISGEINVVAGTGASGDNGDGGPATAAQLNKPFGVALDTAKNIYIADKDNHRIRKVDAVTGLISTIAGTGDAGDDGDGGPATGARINKPRAVRVGPSGNIYIADTDNNKIRRVSTGIISTVAGIGSAGDDGDGGPAISAKLNRPNDVFVQTTGDFYIADTDNNRIRFVDAGTGMITAYAGTGDKGDNGDGGPATAAELGEPGAVSVDAIGNVFIADTGNSKIRRVEKSSGIITTIAGTGTAGSDGDNGPAVNAVLNKPAGLCHGASGVIYIADSKNGSLRKFEAGATITTIYNSKGLGLNKPGQLALDTDNNLYIADTDNHTIPKIDAFGSKAIIAGAGGAGFSGDGGPATDAKLNRPEGLILDTLNNIYFADRDNHCIRKVEASTGIISTIAGEGTKSGDTGLGGPATAARLNKPTALAMDDAGHLYIADTDNHRICVVNLGTGIISLVAGTGEGGFDGDGGPATDAKLNKPRGLFVDADNNILIADTDNHRIRMVDAGTGAISTIIGNGSKGSAGDGGMAAAAQVNKPRGILVDGPGNIYVSDTDNHKVRFVSHQDNRIRTLAGIGDAGYDGDNQPAVDAKLNKPSSIVMPATRGGRRIFISDKDNNRIRVLVLKNEKVLY